MATGKDRILNISSDMVDGYVTLRSCAPCMKDNTSTDATQFCSECVEFLCDDCKRGHSRFKAGNHSFINATEVNDVPVVVDLKEIDKCEEHKKKFKFFCKDHSLLCCSTCAFIHRTCKSVDEIAKISDIMRERLKELNDCLVKVTEKEEDKIEDCTQTVMSLVDTVTKFPKIIDTKKEETIKLFENAKSRITNEANTILANESERLGERKKSSEKILKIIFEILSLSVDVINSGTKQQAFILVQYIANKLHAMDIFDNEQSKKHYSMQLSLEFAKEASSFLEKGHEVAVLINKRNTINSVSSPPIAESSIVETHLSLKPLKSLDSTVAGMDFLPDKRLIVAYADRECVVMDELLQKPGTLFCLSYDPATVVCMSNTEVAIPTKCERIVILSVSQDNFITFQRSLETTQHYSGFCMVNSTTIFAIKKHEINGVKISIVDGTVSLFNKVQFQKRMADVHTAFCICAYLHCSDILIVCDRINERVYLYDTATGASTDVKLDEHIQHVCPGPDNTVLFFCGHSIIHMSHDGKVLSKCTQSEPPPGVSKYRMTQSTPEIICISKDFSRLTATYYNEDILNLMEFKFT